MRGKSTKNQLAKVCRFLSTSLGYKYLDGLDYITQEMDDWFLVRSYGVFSMMVPSHTMRRDVMRST